MRELRRVAGLGSILTMVATLIMAGGAAQASPSGESAPRTVGAEGAIVASVSAGSYFTCGVTSTGTARCWGDNQFNESTPPSGTFTQVSGGFDHACGVRTNGAAVCWGSNSNGQITAPSGTFTQVSAGGFHTYGLTTASTVVCWGSNSNGVRPGVRAPVRKETTS